MTIKNRYQVLKSDRVVFYGFLLHLLLAFFHFAYSFYTQNPQTQCYMRGGFCVLIALLTFLFLRKGFATGLLLYACVLLYFNNFYNYTSFVFILLAAFCFPKIKTPALILYALNLSVALAVKGCAIHTIGIHVINCAIFYFCMSFVYTPARNKLLRLTDDERSVLAELADGKLQKQIEAFSPNTVTKLLKNAQDRNQCRTKTELLHRYIKENSPAIEPQIPATES